MDNAPLFICCSADSFPEILEQAILAEQKTIQYVDHACDRHLVESQLKINPLLWTVEDVIRLMQHRSVSPCIFHEKYPGILSIRIKTFRQWLEEWSHCFGFDYDFGNEEVDEQRLLTLFENLTVPTLPKGMDVEGVALHSRLDDKPGISFAHPLEPTKSDLICNNKSSVTPTALTKQLSSWGTPFTVGINVTSKVHDHNSKSLPSQQCLVIDSNKKMNPLHHHGAHHSLAQLVLLLDILPIGISQNSHHYHPCYHLYLQENPPLEIHCMKVISFLVWRKRWKQVNVYHPHRPPLW